MAVTRRAVLSIIPAASLVAVAGPLRDRAAAAPAGSSAAAAGDQATVLANTVALFAGTTASNARDEVAAKLAAIDSTARSRLAALDSAGSGELFHGVPLGTNDSNLTKSFQYLNQIALATRVPGSTSDLHDDLDVQHTVIDKMGWLYDNYYGDQSKGYYGNWWNWEIGISTQVSNTLALLADTIADYRPDLPATFVAAMDGYLRNGKDGDVDLDSRFHTGANLANITTNRIVQGAVLGDDARISKAVADQLTVYATVDPYQLQHNVTDGYYADGSFIQHASVAYNGSYGKVLLTAALQTITILAGTGYLGGDDLTGVVRGWVQHGFAPVIFEGWMMEAVKGRAISRTTTGYTDAAAVIEGVVNLATNSTGADHTALAGYAKYLHEASKATVNPAKFVSPVTVASYADILSDDSIEPADLNPAAVSVGFNAMDRTVHRRPGFAFTLARSSNRISKYEYMSGENLTPWFEGDGAHYLYLAGQDQSTAFGVDYLTTVSPYRLAGVTAPVEERKTIPQLYGTDWYDNPDAGFTSSSESQNTYVYFPLGTDPHSGGATLDTYGSAALVLSDDAAYAAKQAGKLPGDFVAYRNARAVKSWFLLDDEIVVLAAGVGDPAGRAVSTTVDTRIADPSDTVSLTGRTRDGQDFTGTGTADLSWLRYANASNDTAVGYAFLYRQRPTVSLSTVSRSRRSVRESNPDSTATKQVFGLSVEQPAGARAARMAYAIVPNATERQLAGYRRGPLAVLANSTKLQAIRHGGLDLVCANTFTAGSHHVERFVLDGPACLLARSGRHGALQLAISDPTTERDTVSVIVRGRPLHLTDADEGVTAHRVPGGTRIVATTRHTYGRTRTATLS
ncbi:polysaccharide lyase family 8 super-sandwich domain-containing protein [Actinocatenispora thailandica]|uniref:polysaccharide lyase family 8 super-sandwich domain-containing protein n=1 Tax=Actinocatenispora thailandica TaxID=227318 RepID=UPI001EF27D50|nr:polysaccharide lyase family 8 super-sandwich domain-containing protein [Actinocatenispora thailandica]